MNSLLKKLDKIIALLTAEREERNAEKEEQKRLENEKFLVEYAKAKKKMLPTGGIHSSRELEDRPFNTGGDLIPAHLSEDERQLLREFYGR